MFKFSLVAALTLLIIGDSQACGGRLRAKKQACDQSSVVVAQPVRGQSQVVQAGYWAPAVRPVFSVIPAGGCSGSRCVLPVK